MWTRAAQRCPGFRPATAVLTGAHLVGGTGGAIAQGLISTSDIRDGAVTTAKLHNDAVTTKKIKNETVRTADLAPGARGARVTQYLFDGTLLDTQSPVTVTLPGTFTDVQVPNSAWSVQLVDDRDGEFDPSLFVVGSNPGNDDFCVGVDDQRKVRATIFAESPGIDTIHGIRTPTNSTVTGGTVARTKVPTARTAP